MGAGLSLFFRSVLCGAALLFIALPPRPALAHQCQMCPGDCGAAAEVLKSHHEKGEKDIIKDWTRNPHMRERMTLHKNWLVDDRGARFFPAHFLPKLMKMSTQLTATALDQMRLVGGLFDAKHLLETNRIVQELQVQATRDYTPSESFCWFGTNIRSLAESENRGRFTQAALGAMQMERQLGTYGTASAEDGADMKARWNKFTSTYCDTEDNNSGLSSACLSNASGPSGGIVTVGPSDKARFNIDIDYTRLIDQPRTLPLDFQEAAQTPAGEDVLALASNLYGHNTPLRKMEGLGSTESGAPQFYMQLRSVLAQRNVAQESFNAIVGLKAEADTEGDTARFLGAIAKSAGLEEADIAAYLGQNPSTYAQLEVLAQKMFQSPEFFVTLYDKPANVKRKKAALSAIELMLDRYLYESEMRQEMLLSVLLSASSKREFDEVQRNVQRQNQQQ